MKPTYRDKFLPTQPEHRNYFTGNDEELISGLYALVAKHSVLKRPDEEFAITPSDQFTVEEMASNPILLRFLEFLIALKHPRRVLEIGAFIGVSTMYMARALPPGGEVYTIEKYDRFADVAQTNFSRNGLEGKIRLLRGDAFVELAKLDPDIRFDMIFLDGDKERYAEYFDLLEPRLSPGGLLITDDVFFHGDTVNSKPQTAKGAGTKRFLDKMESAAGFVKILLPLGNGLALMIKPEVGD